MPRVHHVKKARKDNPAVKKGQPYYHWQRYRSRKQYSATYPKRSQLTSSGKLAAIYDAEDSVTDLSIDHDPDALAGSDYRYARVVLTDNDDMTACLVSVMGIIEARYKQTTHISATASASA